MNLRRDEYLVQNRETMKIREGIREDARFLAETVMEAMGEELCIGLAGNRQRLPLVRELFTALAAESDSQYSYTNAFVSESDSGERLGAVIAYDGARLHEQRRAFILQANRILGWNVTEKEAEEWGDEAASDEIYIDSLYVVTKARKQGIASELLNAVERRYASIGKPLGLLVEPDNKIAYVTYIHLGFQEVGISNFFRSPMSHMQKL